MSKTLAPAYLHECELLSVIILRLGVLLVLRSCMPSPTLAVGLQRSYMSVWVRYVYLPQLDSVLLVCRPCLSVWLYACLSVCIYVWCVCVGVCGEDEESCPSHKSADTSSQALMPIEASTQFICVCVWLYRRLGGCTCHRLQVKGLRDRTKPVGIFEAQRQESTPWMYEAALQSMGHVGALLFDNKGGCVGIL